MLFNAQELMIATNQFLEKGYQFTGYIRDIPRCSRKCNKAPLFFIDELESKVLCKYTGELFRRPIAYYGIRSEHAVSEFNEHCTDFARQRHLELGISLDAEPINRSQYSNNRGRIKYDVWSGATCTKLFPHPFKILGRL